MTLSTKLEAPPPTARSPLLHPVEDFLAIIFAVAQAGMGPFFYRFAPPDSL